MKDCYSTVSVDNRDDYATGGLIGKNEGMIVNIFASGEVSGYDYAGGIVCGVAQLNVNRLEVTSRSSPKSTAKQATR